MRKLDYSFLAIIVGVCTIVSACTAISPSQESTNIKNPAELVALTSTFQKTAEVNLVPQVITATITPEVTKETALSDTITPGPAKKPTSTATPEPTTTSWMDIPTTSNKPTATAVPLSGDDVFLAEMQSKGYEIARSGSLVGPGGYTYSAYLFVEPELFKSSLTDQPYLETWVIAFYIWDGEQNQLMATFHGSPYSNSNAVNFPMPMYYYLMDWDVPLVASEYYYEPGDFSKELLKLNGFASDINHNGLPEFAFVGGYCPVSCTDPDIKYDFFEIQNTHRVVNLAASLPDHLSPSPYATDPMTFEICTQRGYEFYLSVIICRLYAWSGNEFEDVTLQYPEKYIGDAEKKYQQLKANYGNPFENYDLTALYVLFLYETAGMREKALQVFIEVTDESHWLGTSDIYSCWIAISRATFQEDYENARPFTMPPSIMSIDVGVAKYLKNFDQSKYDFTSCQTLRP